MIEAAFSLLIFFLVASNVFWAIVSHRLINKLMSRNYAEYIQIEKQLKVGKQEVKVPIVEVSAYEQQRARDLNSMFGNSI